MKTEYNLSCKIYKLTNLKEVKKYTYSDRWIIRQEAIKRLGEIGNDKSIERLIKILKTSKDKYDLIYTNSALGKLKAKAAVPALLKHIDSKKIDVAHSAIYALGEIGDKSAIPSLEKKMKSLRVRDYCKTALKKLNKSGLLSKDSKYK